MTVESNAIISGCYADLKVIKTRKVAQIIIEIPLERANSFVEMFGMPQPEAEVHVAVARLKAQPVAPAQSDDEGARLVQQAALLPKEVAFRRWIHGYDPADGLAPFVREDQAIDALRRKLGVESRAEIRTDPAVAQRFTNLVNDYLTACGRTPGGI